MRGIIKYDNGRLKTGRVSLLVFLCLVLGLGLLFRMHKPVDKAIVVVRHIFAANPEAETKKSPPKESEKPTPPSQQEPIKLADNASTKDLEKIKEKSKELPPKTSPAQAEMLNDDLQKSESPDEKGSQSTMKAAKTPEPALKEIAARADDQAIESRVVQGQPEKPIATKLTSPEPLPAPLPKELKKTATQQPENDPSQVMSEVLETMNEKNISTQIKMEPEELVVDFQQEWHESVKPEAQRVSLMSEANRQRIRENLSKNDSSTAPTKSSQFTAVKIASKKVREADVKPEKKLGRSALKATIAKTYTSAKQMNAKSITVEKQEYAVLHRAWRDVGEGQKENDRLIPLRIENLRSAYNFLQMKAVVIMSDNSCLDLSDGSRIPTASLDRFSSTVMRIDDPWQKWGVELRRAGLRPGQSFEIRYYLYDFVRRSIYARVNQAYNWSINKGLVKAGTKPADIDVLGRAYVVKRSGGGSFGVFVPLSIATRDGRSINIDPLCFNNAPDVAALHAAGVI